MRGFWIGGLGPDVSRLDSRAYRAAQHVAANGEGWTQIDAAPEGEVLWREDGDQVRLTPDGWLVYLNGGKAGLYAKRLRATVEVVRVLRGRPKRLHESSEQSRT